MSVRFCKGSTLTATAPDSYLLSMEMKFVILFLVAVEVVIVLGETAEQDEAGSCDVNPRYRWECGWLGIDKETCEKRGCCWDDSDPSTKFCFVRKYKTLPEGLCPVAPSERQECGYYGITKEECLAKSCCWDESVSNAKWCFKQPEEESFGCYIYHGVSGKCKHVCDNGQRKYYGKGECKGRICCV